MNSAAVFCQSGSGFLSGFGVTLCLCFLRLLWWTLSESLPSCCLVVSAAFEFGFLLQIDEEAALAAALNDYLISRSYLAGFTPSQADQKVFKLLHRPPDSQHVHALRWYRHVASLQQDLLLLLLPDSSSE